MSFQVHFMNASLFPHPLLELWTCMKNEKTKKLRFELSADGSSRARCKHAEKARAMRTSLISRHIVMRQEP